jgi:hypothetical protein
MADSVLTDAEAGFLRALNDLGIRYMLVGMSGALLQGARGATDDIDIWFETIADERIAEAARRVGGFWVSGAFGMRPPALGGAVLGDRFDVVILMHGLRSFDEEYSGSLALEIDGVRVRVLPLARILASKKAAGRPKDLAQIPALQEAMAAGEVVDPSKPSGEA